MELIVIFIYIVFSVIFIKKIFDKNNEHYELIKSIKNNKKLMKKELNVANRELNTSMTIGILSFIITSLSGINFFKGTEFFYVALLIFIITGYLYDRYNKLLKVKSFLIKQLDTK